MKHRLLEVPTIGDVRGKLLVAQANDAVPFDIKRLFVLYALPPGASRGYHAHREQHQFLMMLAGACDIIIDDGVAREMVTLNHPSMALYAPPMLWLELSNFTSDAICAVLTSGEYDEVDYIRDRSEFELLARY